VLDFILTFLGMVCALHKSISEKGLFSYSFL
jgi:hypothetical protein